MFINNIWQDFYSHLYCSQTSPPFPIEMALSFLLPRPLLWKLLEVLRWYLKVAPFLGSCLSEIVRNTVICQPLGEGSFSGPPLLMSLGMVPSDCPRASRGLCQQSHECPGQKWVGQSPQLGDAPVLWIPNGTT